MDLFLDLHELCLVGARQGFMVNAGFERSSLGLRWLVSLSTAARGHAASAPSLPCGADGKAQPVLVQRRSFEQKEEELAHRLHCPQGKGPPAERGGWRGWQQGQSALRALLRLLLPVSPFSFLGGLLLLFASPTPWKSKNPYQSFLPLTSWKSGHPAEKSIGLSKSFQTGKS